MGDNAAPGSERTVEDAEPKVADARPFHYAGDHRGVLVIHGFSGTPFEVSLLGRSLAARGYTVAGPALAGHGPDAATLADRSYGDWYATVAQALDELRATCSVVGVCGLSLGGLLTLELARRRREQITAIACMATALRLPPFMMRGIRRAQRSPFLRRLAIPKLGGSDIADKKMKKLNPSRDLPFRALGQLVEFMDHVQATVGEVDRPALVVHGRHDHTIPYACLEEVAGQLKGPVERLTLERSNHVITLDVEREALFRRVGDFFGHFFDQVRPKLPPRA